jgi:putative spermidine/putrescine transport system substrate-binding protein
VNRNKLLSRGRRSYSLRRSRLLGLALASALSAAALAACAPPSDNGGGGGGAKAATATSAQDLGGMDALVKAAQKEGELNVIALPPDCPN